MSADIYLFPHILSWHAERQLYLSKMPCCHLYEHYLSKKTSANIYSVPPYSFMARRETTLPLQNALLSFIWILSLHNNECKYVFGPPIFLHGTQSDNFAFPKCLAVIYMNTIFPKKNECKYTFSPPIFLHGTQSDNFTFTKCLAVIYMNTIFLSTASRLHGNSCSSRWLVLQSLWSPLFGICTEQSNLSYWLFPRTSWSDQSSNVIHWWFGDIRQLGERWGWSKNVQKW